MKKSAIIVAAGSGTRMGNSTPKQFIEVAGLPILMHTLRRFYEFDEGLSLILVISESENKTWESLIRKHNFKIPHQVIFGGSTRFESVSNGLKVVEGGIVAIHDGVRPCVSKNLIALCFNDVEKYSNAIPAIPLVDSIREINGKFSRIVDRTNLRRIQTPQCFDLIKLKKAFSNAKHSAYTDDAAVFEDDGNEIHLVNGEEGNIKITSPVDLILIKEIMKKES